MDPVLQLKLPKGRYEWEVAVLTLALWAGIAVRDVPCQVYYPPPEERVSSFRPFFDNVRISLLNCRLVAGRILWPPRWINRVPEPGGVWRGQHLGRTWGWRFFFILLRILGRTPAHLCMACMATFYFLIASSHRRGVLTYAIRVRPKSSRAGRLWLTWRVFFRFACSLIDRFHMMAKGPQALSVDSRGSEAARETMHTEGGILMASHMGNADLAGMVLGTTNKVRRVHQVQYTSTHDPYLTLMNQVLDPDKRPVIISLNDQMGLAGLTITQALRDGHIVAMKGDRVIDDRTVKVKFLGEDISFPAGPFLVAALTRVPVVTMGCFAEGKGYRLLTTGPKTYAFTSRKNRDADLQGWVQDYALTLETWARRYPDQWYNFHDIWT